ncbi:unnamed protein product [Cyprideis torosa]|uniref:Uncharacterized protein n=1 Tax=Cyprideis torosa TaxID=163714 RepID=A0A7R8WYS2_9CRUS|nr:unnamed protein product [Cyprideis torosa]CAG0908812.1 unnamed protein product [Cyprideis torosa]
MKVVAILMGGYDGEREISMQRGNFVFQHIDTTVYKPVKAYILPEGWYVEIDDEKIEIDRSDFSFLMDGHSKKIELCYNTIHGTPGEDGYLQAYFDLLGVSYTGCDAYVSALTFNKSDCNLILKGHGQLVPNAITLKKENRGKYTYDAFAEELGPTFMVKACRSGSSLGVSKVNEAKDFVGALDSAFAVDNLAVAESFIKGTEVSVGAFRDLDGLTNIMEPTEIVTHNDFFDFEAKYKGASEEITPARIAAEERALVQQKTKEIYDLLNISGIARIDFIIRDGLPHFIEVNTTPGLSPQSIFPQQARHAGLDLSINNRRKKT